MSARPAILAAAALAVLALAPASAHAAGNGRIAFARDTAPGQTELFSVNPDGTGLVDLAAGTDPAWSPDGARLAFSTGGEIWVANADGSGARPLTTTAGADTAPAWSPEGRRIAFTSERDGNAEVYVMNADGSGQANLTNQPLVLGPPRRGQDTDPAWSADGTRIFFSSDRGGDADIWAMGADGSAPAVVMAQPDSEDEAPAAAPDGAAIAYASTGGATGDGIALLSPRGTTIGSLINEDAIDEAPAFSPDGTRLVFQSDGRPTGPGLYTIAAGGTSAARLPSTDARDHDPAWQPCPSCGSLPGAGAGFVPGTGAKPGAPASAAEVLRASDPLAVPAPSRPSGRVISALSVRRLAVTVRCVRACRLTSELLLGAKGKRTRILGRARGRLSSAGRTRLPVRVAASRRRAARRTRHARLVLRTTAIDAAGRVEVVDKRLSIRALR